ncbi:MAG: SagB/ThcOx family dehydrogenase, partial [Planctomycetes bacterium]|nr:SagB/ThcOx family dehydrogenase [Planctomycetota bacterium]
DVREWQLRLERAGDLSSEAHRFCLMQDLALDANMVIVHSADLKRAVETYGERVYRALHLDAGVIGQLLNLAALREGLGVSGIGGFFDDQVNAALGLPLDHAILYVTVIGAADRSGAENADEDLEE